MTVRVPMLNTDTDTAETFRLALGGLWVPTTALNPRTGVTTTPVLTGTGNLTATVGPFTGMIDGTSGALQGGYPVALDAAGTVTIGAGNTQARIDLISLQVDDNDYDGSGLHQGVLVVTAGVPSGSPVAPATPANAIPLWTISVPALATSVTWASATAVFPYTAAAGGIVPARNASDKPAAAAAVQYRHRLDVTAAAGSVSPLESSVNGSTWTPVFDPSGFTWAPYTPVWSSGSSPQPSVGNGGLTGRYYKIGRFVAAFLTLSCGSTTTFGTGTWAFTLPFNCAYTGAVGGAVYATIGATTSYGIAYMGGSNAVQFQFLSSGAFASPTTPGTWATGSFLNASFFYESTS